MPQLENEFSEETEEGASSLGSTHIDESFRLVVKMFRRLRNLTDVRFTYNNNGVPPQYESLVVEATELMSKRFDSDPGYLDFLNPRERSWRVAQRYKLRNYQGWTAMMLRLDEYVNYHISNMNAAENDYYNWILQRG